MTGEITPSQDLAPSRRWVYYAVRSEGPITPTEIAEVTGYSRQHVHRCLNTLLEEDLVTADSNPADRRQTRYDTSQ